MADDAEAAFLRSMQMANEASGNYGAMDIASEQQPDSSSDEYDPAQAVQAVSTSHEAYLISNDLSSTVTGNVSQPSRGSTPQQLALAFDQDPAKASPPGILTSDTQDSSTSKVDSPTINATTPEAPANGDAYNADSEDHGREALRPISNGDLGLNGSTTHSIVSHSLSDASLKQLSATDISIQNDVKDQPPTERVMNGISQSVPDLTAVSPNNGASSDNLPTALPSETLSVPHLTQTEPAATPKPLPQVSAPRARLPHDKIGILEDRVKQDPRGDLDAWLSLIGEHKKRGKINEARSVYERLFKVFPQAVRS